MQQQSKRSGAISPEKQHSSPAPPAALAALDEQARKEADEKAWADVTGRDAYVRYNLTR